MGAMDPVGGSRADAGGGTACLNCNSVLRGPFCSACGQKAQLPRSLRSFFADFAAGVLNFDGKFWRTLPMLAWCPGDLTRRYVDGERVRFISPVGLYLFTVFLMFAVLGLSGGLQALSSGEDFYAGAIRDEQAKLRKLETQRREQVAAGQEVVKLDLEIDETKADLAGLEQVRSGKADLDGLEGSPDFVRDAVTKTMANPQAAMTKVQQAASTYSWLLIPLSVPALRLLFPFRRRRMYDHTVFVTYSLSFMMVLVVVGGLMTLLGAGAYLPWLSLIPPWHMYRQLKGAYGLSRMGALLRTSLLLVASFMILLVWFMIIVAVGSLT
jgi:Protein of unknown function (DUF3667)